MLKPTAILILLIGVVIAATAAMQLPDPEQTFAPSAPLIVLGVLIAVSGVALWHVSLYQERKGIRRTPADRSDPFALLRDIKTPLLSLQETASNQSTDQLSAAVESLIQSYVLPFSEVRHRIIEQLGMRRGAEVLVDFAVVERMLNRAWSAASDESWSEAIASINEAPTAYKMMSLALDP